LQINLNQIGWAWYQFLWYLVDNKRGQRGLNNNQASAKNTSKQIWDFLSNCFKIWGKGYQFINLYVTLNGNSSINSNLSYLKPQSVTLNIYICIIFLKWLLLFAALFFFFDILVILIYTVCLVWPLTGWNLTWFTLTINLLKPDVSTYIEPG
jgi:hypothetical protein